MRLMEMQAVVDDIVLCIHKKRGFTIMYCVIHQTLFQDEHRTNAQISKNLKIKTFGVDNKNIKKHELKKISPSPRLSSSGI